MDKQSKKPLYLKIFDSVGIILAFLAIIISGCDLFGVLEGVPFIKARILPAILFLVGAVVLLLVLERNFHFTNLTVKLEEAIDAFNAGVYFLKNKNMVDEELKKIVLEAGEYIYAIGSKSSNPQYLSEIEHKVNDNGIEYRRILSGNHITHEMHLSHKNLIDIRSTRIYWTEKEKFGNFTVTEKKGVFVIPSPIPEKYTGFMFNGELNASRYKSIFVDILAASTPVVSQDGLWLLCEECGSRRKRLSNEAICEKLKEEQKKKSFSNEE